MQGFRASWAGRRAINLLLKASEETKTWDGISINVGVMEEDA